MEKTTQAQKVMIDLLLLNKLNAEGCPACGGRFTLGEMVVPACGAWDGGAKYIHEAEATFDAESRCYFERSFYHSDRKHPNQVL